jgi:D-3-phosphoglycerate dehydrogenase
MYPRVEREKLEYVGVEFVEYTELFERATVVTMHVPLTPENDSMVGIDEFEALEGGYFLNLSRGGVVDEGELIEAVDRDLLAGVALDVLADEPPDPSNPLLKAPNVHITPHIAGGKEGYASRSAEINAKRITAVLHGEVPDGLVNPDSVSEE